MVSQRSQVWCRSEVRQVEVPSSRPKGAVDFTCDGNLEAASKKPSKPVVASRRWARLAVHAGCGSSNGSGSQPRGPGVMWHHCDGPTGQWGGITAMGQKGSGVQGEGPKRIGSLRWVKLEADQSSRQKGVESRRRSDGESIKAAAAKRVVAAPRGPDG